MGTQRTKKSRNSPGTFRGSKAGVGCRDFSVDYLQAAGPARPESMGPRIKWFWIRARTGRRRRLRVGRRGSQPGFVQPGQHERLVEAAQEVAGAGPPRFPQEGFVDGREGVSGVMRTSVAPS